MSIILTSNTIKLHIDPLASSQSGGHSEHILYCLPWNDQLSVCFLPCRRRQGWLIPKPANEILRSLSYGLRVPDHVCRQT